jgi:AcrR family transcriptional regulator
LAIRLPISIKYKYIEYWIIVVNVTKSSPHQDRHEISRKYASPLRASQAAQTRQRILDAASTCFSRSGYVGTTLCDIAACAGVSVESVQAHGPKATLLLSAFEKAFALSEGQESIFDRPEIVELTNLLTDPVGFVREACMFLADAAARSAQLWLVFLQAAGADPTIKLAFDSLTSRIRVDTLRLVTMVADRGEIRSDRSRQQLADELEVLFLPIAFDRLVHGAGWSLDDFSAYLFENVSRILFSLDRQPAP